jgi:hypothetical protein
VRGTLKGIEVERWGGEQAHRWVGSLKPLQDLYNAIELSGPASASFFTFRPVLPLPVLSLLATNWCGFLGTYL